MKRKTKQYRRAGISTLINFTGMKRLNARGKAVNKKNAAVAATVYNLKKWLRFTRTEHNY